MKNWQILILVCGLGLLLAGCIPTCTEQNRAKFASDVAQINQTWDTIEFNVAYSPEAKASQLKQLRDQANLLYTPACADSMKSTLLNSLEERIQNIGNYNNQPRPVTEYLQKELKAFQAASIGQLNGQVNIFTNNTARLWVGISLMIVVVVLLVACGAYFYFVHGRRKAS